MRTLILCGGRGTRAYPQTVEIPKPLLEVGDLPILAHVMGIYARQGFADFVLAAGYRADLVEAFARSLPRDWSVEVVDTGLEANTGARVRQCAPLMGDCYFATYADGVADVVLHDLLRFHRSHRGAATLTTVPLPSQYGTVESNGEAQVVRFCEKPKLPDHWINAGFFVFDQRASSWLDRDDLEREVLPALSADGQLYSYRHRGFWKSLDTYKDALELNALCADGPPPWESSIPSAPPEELIHHGVTGTAR